MAASSMLKRVDALRAELASFDPALLTGADCALVVAELGLLAKACDAAVARAAARAADCGEHRRAGFADAGTWLAQTNGTPVAEALTALDAVHLVEATPTARHMLAAGELSLGQAAEIARTEQHAPGSERAMIEAARSSGFKGLKDEGRRRRHEAADREELHRRQHRSRRAGHWRDDLGMTCINLTLPPETGVPLVANLEAETDRIWRAERRRLAGHLEDIEPRQAYMADALLSLLRGAAEPHATSRFGDGADGGDGDYEDRSGPSDRSDRSDPQTDGQRGRRSRRRPKTELVIVWDLNAYRRGHPHPGEPSHIIGGGPIPDELMRELTKDAFLKVVIHDGVNVHTVSHLGRHIPAELRTALTLGSPPLFTGAVCECGCDRTHRLEVDHQDPLAHGGRTELANLEPKCGPSHDLKTELDRAAGLLDPRNSDGPGP